MTKKSQTKSFLSIYNVKIEEKRTSIRLEPAMWRELNAIAERESCTIHELATLISSKKPDEASLTAAVRVFLMLYYRAAATESGHKKAGHGCFEGMKRRAGIVFGEDKLKSLFRELLTEMIADPLELDEEMAKKEQA